MTAGLRLGAPGVYRASARPADPAFAEVRLDVTGFVGVALRGPVDRPVRVTGWSDFQRRFGGVTDPDGRLCPGQLPAAVQLYFAQGGAAAWITRVGPPDDAPATDPETAIPPATAAFRLGPTDTVLTAADPGSWGNRLDIHLEFDDTARFTPLRCLDDRRTMIVPDRLAVPTGSLLRLRGSGTPAVGSLHWVTAAGWQVTGGRRHRWVAIDPPLPGATEPAARRDAAIDAGVDDVAVIDATLVIVDTDPTFQRSERISGLGLHPDHPRYLADPDLLPTLSLLVRPAGGTRPALLPPLALPDIAATSVASGVDRWEAIDGRSFFDDGPPDADLLDEAPVHRGVDAAGRVDEIGLLCVPDLAWSWRPESLPAEEATPARYDPCGGLLSQPLPAMTYLSAAEPGHQLDAGDPDQLAELVRRQLRIVQVADLRRQFVAMLDVPRALPVAEIIRWRVAFDSSFAAAYHPWLGVPGSRPAAAVSYVAPSVFACGITASRERRLGLPWGPANEIATAAVTAADLVTDEIHDRLHLIGINAFRGERDGYRLTAARTLSTDRDYVQLSVRRLMTMIALTLVRQSQWLVFEPNTPTVRTQLSQALIQFLGALFRRGAFTGTTEREAFFVRCDDTTNFPVSLAQGRLIAEIGLAPAAPLEYLVLRIAQDSDGALQVEPVGD